MPNRSKPKIGAEEIAGDMALRTGFPSFTEKFTVVRPARRVNVDLTRGCGLSVTLVPVD